MDSSAPVELPVDTTNHINAIVLPIFSALAIIVTYLPLRSFYQNRNFPAFNIVIVGSLLNLITIVNAAIWPNGDWSSWWMGYGFCDVQVYIKVPLTTAVATSLACLTWTLANALDVDRHNFNQSVSLKRRALLRDIAFCWTIPIIQIALFYIVQVNRYLIAPVYGCGVQFDDSWLTVVIFGVWAPLAALFSSYHAIIIMLRLRKHRTNLSSALSSGNSGYTSARYLKLSILALSLILVLLPIEFYYFHLNLPKEFVPYSWARVHDPLVWGAIVFISTSDAPNIQYNGWISVALSFMVFLFFGFSNSAMDVYRNILVFLGAGLIWPSLKIPREDRSRGGSESSRRGSWSSHFDLVGKAVKYFDTSRKHSQATSEGMNSACSPSRKGSSVATSNVPLTNISSAPSLNQSRKDSIPQSSSGSTSCPGSDGIAPTPLVFGNATPLAPIQEPEEPVSFSSVIPKNHGILSVFRTHINLPLPLFSSQNKTSEKRKSGAMDQNSQHQDLEFQTAPRNNSISKRTPTTVSTAIWSDSNTFPPVSNNSPSHSNHPSTDESVDPLSPKMGTRAFRERERREMELEKKEERLRVLKKKMAEDLGSGVDGGVVKTVKLERSEENAGPSA